MMTFKISHMRSAHPFWIYQSINMDRLYLILTSLKKKTSANNHKKVSSTKLNVFFKLDDVRSGNMISELGRLIQNGRLSFFKTKHQGFDEKRFRVLPSFAE